jgi:hypothetical protein
MYKQKKKMLFPPEQYEPYLVLQCIILRVLDITFQKPYWHQDGRAAISAE